VKKRVLARTQNYLVLALTGFCIVLVMEWLFPNIIPFTAFEFWHIRDSGPSDWLYSSWPILAWGGGFTFLVAVFTRNDSWLNDDAEGLFIKDTLISVWAGVVEEICFRWLIFLAGIATVKFFNVLFFGFLGFGIPQWLQIYIMGPVANFFTLGYLAPVLVAPGSWAIGSALLGANALFRDGHKYLGWVGFANSWFIGMFFFWLLFTYGLVACIFIHFLYDFLISSVIYLDRVAERKFWDR